MAIADILVWGMNNKIIVVGIALVLFLAFTKFKKKKPYCLVRIKELRGKSIIDHPKEYPAYIKEIVDDQGNKIQWMFIEGIKRNWKPVKGDELTPTVNGSRLVELLWFGGNLFQKIEISPFVFKKDQKTKTYKRKRIDKFSMRVVPDENMYLEHEITHTINKLSNTEPGWLTWLKSAAIFLVVIMISAILFYKVLTYTTDGILSKLDETNNKLEGIGNRFITAFNDYQQRNVDENTKAGGVEVDSGGG